MRLQKLPHYLGELVRPVYLRKVTGSLDDPRIAGRLRVTRFSYLATAFDSLDADVSASPENLELRNAVLARGPSRAQFQVAVGLNQWKTGDGSLIFGNATIRDAPLGDLAALADCVGAGTAMGASPARTGATWGLIGSAGGGGAESTPRGAAVGP